MRNSRSGCAALKKDTHTKGFKKQKEEEKDYEQHSKKSPRRGSKVIPGGGKRTSEK